MASKGILQDGADGNATPVNAAVGPAAGPAADPPSTAPAPAVVKYCASIYPKPPTELNFAFASAVKQLEQALGYPVWLIIQTGQGIFGDVDDDLYEALYAARTEIEKGSPVGLVIHSGGGDASAAFRIARLFQRRATPLTTIIPKYAKSAATLMALGGANIVKDGDAEFGPLDVQVLDLEREEYGSALNAVQSLERINAFSLTVIDQLTPLLVGRSGRKLDVILPMVMEYSVNLVRPLLEKIDTVDFTRRSRELKVAEEYAFRLMRANYPSETAKRIAQHLVDQYPTHEFVIDRDECKNRVRMGSTFFGIGLHMQDATPEVDAALGLISPFLGKTTVIGQVKELTP
jgi:Serine dehydrogenase proteinase